MSELQTWAIVAVPIVTGLGLLFAYLELRKQQETRELQLVENIMKNLDDMERRLIDEAGKWDKGTMQSWDIQFMNEVEWLCFLFNEKKIRDKNLKEFWKGSIFQWHDDIFLKHFSKEEIENETVFTEVKKFCKDNKDNRTVS